MVAKRLICAYYVLAVWVEEFILLTWYLYWCHSNYIGAMAIILVQWCVDGCNGIYVSSMVFIWMPWYFMATIVNIEGQYIFFIEAIVIMWGHIYFL